jgi:hypothetical protein
VDQAVAVLDDIITTHGIALHRTGKERS